MLLMCKFWQSILEAAVKCYTFNVFQANPNQQMAYFLYEKDFLFTFILKCQNITKKQNIHSIWDYIEFILV